MGGMALNLTPCVYPLIPITVSYFGGLSGGSRRRLVAHGLFIYGWPGLTNTVLGVAAALTGGLMGSMLQNPVVLVVIAGILLVFATSLFGLWDNACPKALTKSGHKILCWLFRHLVHGSHPGPGRGALHRPLCAGTPYLGGQPGISLLLGFTVFFTLSLGLGLPLFFLALFSGSLEKLPRSGEWIIGSENSWAGCWWVWPCISSGRCCRHRGGIILLGLIALAAGVHLAFLD